MLFHIEGVFHDQAQNQGTRVSHAISDGSLYKTGDDVITQNQHGKSEKKRKKLTTQIEMFVRAPRVDVARMLRCHCSIRRRCSQPEQNATRLAPSVHVLVAVLPSRFLAFSLIALKVLGRKK